MSRPRLSPPKKKQESSWYPPPGWEDNNETTASSWEDQTDYQYDEFSKSGTYQQQPEDFAPATLQSEARYPQVGTTDSIAGSSYHTLGFTLVEGAGRGGEGPVSATPTVVYPEEVTTSSWQGSEASTAHRLGGESFSGGIDRAPSGGESSLDLESSSDINQWSVEKLQEVSKVMVFSFW